MLNLLLREIANLKWHVVIYAVCAVAFCAFIYLDTREFNWSFRKIHSFAILYNLNTRGRITLGLIFGRLIYIACMVIFGGGEGFWDLGILLIFTIVITVLAGSWKELIEIAGNIIVFIIAITENMFINFYHEVDDNKMIVVVAVFFGIFALLYGIFQALSSYDRLLAVQAANDKKNFDREFYGRKEAR